jgi:AAA family ATP:ADP antiporter
MSDFSSDDKSFGRLRSTIWPIHRYELKKLLPMLFMFFFISFDYNVLRTMKDTLVVTAKSSGAEVIPFIKVWVMFPGAVLMTLLFTKLSNRISREKVFYIIISIFLGYFFIFTFFLYPNQDALHPHEFADSLQSILPTGCKGLIAMIRNWTLTLFYVMSELWSNIVFFVLFWGFANQITRLHEAKRFYGLFGFGANLSGIFAGQVSVFLSRKAFDPNIPFGASAWEQSMMLLMTLVLISGVLALILFRWMNKVVLVDPRFYDPNDVKSQKEVKGKLSLKENFSFLLKTKYLLYITAVVVAYNVVINLVEVVWKDQLKELYPNPSEYNIYFNQVSTIIGIVATFAAVFVSGNVIRKCGWMTTAMLTPIVMLGTSVVFFILYFLKGSLEGTDLLLYFGMTPISMIVMAGSVQNILSRGAKYTVFDASKEMAFVPLSLESKLKGKAAIDGICNRFGKSGGSMIHQSLLIAFSSFAASAPYVATILFFIIGIWMSAIKKLGVEFDNLTAPQTTASIQQKEKEGFTSPEKGDLVLAGQQSV